MVHYLLLFILSMWLFIIELASIQAFVISPTLHLYGSISSLSYSGPSRQDDINEEEKDTVSSAKNDIFQKQLNEQLVDPACDIDDEECIEFSLALNSNINEDPLCDAEDVDCQEWLGSPNIEDTNLDAELKSRSEYINTELIDNNWKTAYCPTSFIPISKSDWVRRVHMQKYPIAVCGAASGSLYVVNLEEERVIAKTIGVHDGQVSKEQQAGRPSINTTKQAMEKLYGRLDGGGVIAVQIHDDIVASSGREGGVKLSRITKYENDMHTGDSLEDIVEGDLVPLGSIHELQKTIVTSLKFDSNGNLWCGCYDGTIRAYNMSDTSTAQFPPPQKPLFQSDFTDSVLDMDLCEDLTLGVAATADGGAALFDMSTGQFFAGMMLFDGYACRSVVVVKHASDQGYSVMAGGSDGTIHRLPLKLVQDTGSVDQDNPFDVLDTDDTTIKPKPHTGPVMSMASQSPGKFISGGQDTSLRIWQFIDETAGDDNKEEQTDQNKLQTKCLYALTGYKLWLGSICTDCHRLVSDGGNENIILRDFSRDRGIKGK